MYAFISHESACEVLRVIGDTSEGLPRWPSEPRVLPRHRNTVTTQGMLRQFVSSTDLATYGLTQTPIHLLVPKAAERSRGKTARFHAWKGDVPARAMLRLSEELFVSTPEFALVQMAGWHTRIGPIADTFADELKTARETYSMAGIEEQPPHDDPFLWNKAVQTLKLILVAMEFMGTYRLATPDGTTTYGRAPIVSASRIERFVDSMHRVYGRNRVEAVLSLAMPHSASPMETALALMLSLPTEYGGFGLPRPKLNRPIPVEHHEFLWTGGATIKPDILWPDARLVIEYDSDEWHGSVGAHKLARDATRSNVLSTLGYNVLHVTTRNIQRLTDVELLAHQVAVRLGDAPAAPDEILRIRRGRLHRLLLRQ